MAATSGHDAKYGSDWLNQGFHVPIPNAEKLASSYTRST